MSKPVVSIISPTYNHDKYIAECIESVQRQSFTEWEMIIIDDGSTDDTFKIASKYASADIRITVLTQANVGVFRLGETYNRGLQMAKGKYIAILEGDDLWEPDKLARQIKALENDTQAVLAWGRAEAVSGDLSTVYDIRPSVWPEHSLLYNNQPTGSILHLLSMGSFIPALTVIMRRDKLQEIGGFIQSHGLPLIDFTTVLKLSLTGPFLFDKEVLGKWRNYPTQTTKKFAVQMFEGFIGFLEEHLQMATQLPIDVKKKIMKFYMESGLIAYARSGRYKLIRKEFKNARKDYAKAIFYRSKGKWMWRIRSIVGYILSFFHMDVEWLAQLLGKKTYKG